VRRQAAAVLIAFAAATSILGFRATPVSAECGYLPPWPEITGAIPSAREVIVGEIVTDFNVAELNIPTNEGRDYALRVTHVLRGDRRPGDIVDVQFMYPNWPQTRYSGGTLSSCTYLTATPGEVIALAFDALEPGGPMEHNRSRWVQPPTRYNALGVITGSESDPLYGTRRERVTLAQLQHLASLPPTDTLGPPSVDSADPRLPVAASIVGLLIAWRRFSDRRRVGQRVAPDGVRRSER